MTITYKRGLWSALTAFSMESGVEIVEIDCRRKPWPEPKATHHKPTEADHERMRLAEEKRQRKMKKRSDRKEA